MSKTTQEKLLEAAEAALDGWSTVVLGNYHLYEEYDDVSHYFSNFESRCLYLCLLAAAWDDL